MLNGNISNRVAPILLMRVEDTLFTKSKPSLKGIFNKKTRYSLDLATFDFIMRTHMATDYRVDLVIDLDLPFETQEVLKQLIEEYCIPHSAIRYSTCSDIYTLISSGVYLCYIDNHINRINKVGHTHCYPVSEANNFIKR